MKFVCTTECLAPASVKQTMISTTDGASSTIKYAPSFFLPFAIFRSSIPFPNMPCGFLLHSFHISSRLRPQLHFHFVYLQINPELNSTSLSLTPYDFFDRSTVHD